MKYFLQTTFSLLIVLLLTTDIFAQVPQGFNFQAVARDADGLILSDQSLSVQVNIIQGTETGETVYSEVHNLQTDSEGVFKLIIGEGTTQDDFSGISWADDNFYIGLAVDTEGGTNYEDLGTTRLLSVPYALMAQDVVNVPNGSGGASTQFELDTASGDTSFVVNAVGPTGLTAIRGNASTDGSNRGVTGTANSEATNDNSMYGVLGTAPGLGTGTHIGVLGSAVNSEASGTAFRYGIYGQALSKHKENIGGFGIGLGDGNGDIVMPGNEVDGNVGSVNAGLIGWARGNSNFNIGVRGRAYGTSGARANVGVQATSDASANAPNIGVDLLVNGSQQSNTGIFGFINGSNENRGINLTVGDGNGINKGMILNVNGASSIGAEVFADTALVLHGYTFSHNGATYNGDVQVNGNLNYSGSLNNTSDRKLKENITPIQNAVDVLMALQPASYTFKGNGSYNGLTLSEGLHYGLIAQEVERVLPSLVKDNVHMYETVEEVPTRGPDSQFDVVTREMNYKSLNYTELIPFLIKAVQEQQKEIDLLKKELKKANS
jgi:hypothetical protein